MLEVPCKVLLIEDDDDDYLLIRQLLARITSTRFEVERCVGYEDGIEILRQRTHDVCLLDYSLGARNGVTLLREADAAQHDVPVIMLTGAENYDADVQAMEAGAVDYLVKGHINGPLLERALRYAIERKRSEMQLRESELRYRTISDSAPDAIITINDDGTIHYINPTATAIFGYTLEELQNQPLTLILPPAQHPAFETNDQSSSVARQLLQRFLDLPTGSQTHTKRGGIEATGRHKKGHLVPVEMSCSTYHVAGRHFYTAIVRDISQRKANESALRESEARYRAAVAGSLDAFYIFESVRDADGIITDFRFIDLNVRGAKLIGMPREHVVGQHLCDLLPINRSDGFFERYVRVVETREPLEEEFEIDFPNLGLRWWHHQVVPLGDGIAITTDDISERKHAEQTLHESESRFRSVVTNLGEGLIITNFDDVILDINPRMAELSGYTAQEMIGRPAYELLLPPEEWPTLRARNEQRRQGNAELYEVRLCRKDGEFFWAEVNATPYQNADGEIVGTLGAVTDISERKQTEAALRASQQRFQRIADNVPGLVFQVARHADGSLYFPYLSDGGRGIFELELEEIYQNPHVVFNMVHPDDRESFFASINASGEHLSWWKWEGRVVPRSGEVKWIQGGAKPEAQSNGEIVWDGLLIDITARRQAEEALLRTQQELEARVASRTAELAQANQTLEVEIGERRHAEEQMRQRARQQEAVAQLSQSALSRIDLDTLLNGAVSLVAATLNVQWSSIASHEEEQQRYAVRHGVGWPPGVVEKEYLFPAPNSQVGYALLTGNPVITPDIRQETRYEIPEFFKEHGVQSSACVLIPGAQFPHGVLGVEAREVRDFSPEDIQFLQSMANVVATAIESRQLEEALRESRSRMQAILDNTSALIYIKAPDGRYLMANREYFELARMTPEEFIGKTDYDFLPASVADELRQNDLVVLENNEPVTVEERYTRRDQVLYMLSTKFPLYDAAGTLSGIGGISTDITERKQAEDARESAHREADRARIEAEHAREEADRANQAKSEFLSRMSHELRTPLNAILGFAQLLEIAQLQPRQNQSVAQILKAGNHLLTLINEVLDIARIETGRLSISIEPVALTNVLHEVVDLVGPLAVQSEVTLNINVDAAHDNYVMADRQRLIQVLLNLLSNAVKYNYVGGRVDVSCLQIPPVYGSPNLGRIRVSVRDTGRGVAPENIERLWTPFDRLDADKAGIEGTGLGLTLSKHLMETMGGTLQVESTLGGGSTFSIELPLTSAPDSARRAALAGLAENETPSVLGTVLYIEDNVSNFMLIEQVLQHRPGIKLMSAMQGSVGFDLAREHRPNLILLDLNLPDTHGADVLRRLKQEPSTRNIPVIVVSADATPKQMIRLQAEGADDYLTKPLDIQRLLGVLDNILSAQVK
jgi:PAS domain S-box-containing protein